MNAWVDTGRLGYSYMWANGARLSADGGRFELTALPDSARVIVDAYKAGYVQQCAAPPQLMAADTTVDIELIPRSLVSASPEAVRNRPGFRSISGVVYENMPKGGVLSQVCSSTTSPSWIRPLLSPSPTRTVGTCCAASPTMKSPRSGARSAPVELCTLKYLAVRPPPISSFHSVALRTVDARCSCYTFAHVPVFLLNARICRMLAGGCLSSVSRRLR